MGGEGAGKEYGPHCEGGVRREGCTGDRGSRWRSPRPGASGLVDVGGFAEREEKSDDTLLCDPAEVISQPEVELETSGEGWIPSLADYWEERSGSLGSDGGNQTNTRWWPGGYYSGGPSPTTAVAPYYQPDPQLGITFPHARKYSLCPDTPRSGGPCPEQPEAREEWRGRTAGVGNSAGLGRSQVSSRPRRSFIPRPGGYRRRGGRPRWDDRFGFLTRDAAPRGREVSREYLRGTRVSQRYRQKSRVAYIG